MRTIQLSEKTKVELKSALIALVIILLASLVGTGLGKVMYSSPYLGDSNYPASSSSSR